MRNKKLVALLLILCGVATIIILMSVIFSIQKIEAKCATPYGESDTLRNNILNTNVEIEQSIKSYKMSSIFLFSESKMLEEVNQKVSNADAYNVECLFPNKVIIHYNYVSPDYQVFDGEKYLIASTSSKILESNEYDSLDPDLPYISETLINVIPSIKPKNNTVGSYLYSSEDDDQIALGCIFNTIDNLVKKETDKRVFAKASIRSIDLSNPRQITLSTRAGVLFKLNFDTSERKNLQTMITTMVSWYIDENSEKILSGIATISDNTPTRVVHKNN